MLVARRARARLHELRAQDLLRRCPAISERRGVIYRLDDRPVVGFCSNDYLGLATAPPDADPLDPAAGATASRLICGDHAIHRHAERVLAELVGAEDAVLFPSGFQLNVGVLPCLLEAGDVVHSDQLNHASLIDGMRLAAPTPRRLPHGHAPPRGRPDDEAVRWWISESIFSMDGDRIDPAAVRAHLDDDGAAYVDEAHALGLFDAGTGWLGHHGVAPTVCVGTLSKALGAAGAFVAADAPICDLVRNRARSYVFSTGMSPLLASRIVAHVARVRGPEGAARRARLWANAATFARALDLPEPPSPIFPFVVGDNALALDLAANLLDRGWHVQAIRPPTVPPGTARLRVTLSADHTAEHVQALAADLRTALDEADRPVRLGRGATHG